MICNVRYMHIAYVTTYLFVNKWKSRKLGRKSQNQIGTDFETPGKNNLSNLRQVGSTNFLNKLPRRSLTSNEDNYNTFDIYLFLVMLE